MIIKKKYNNENINISEEIKINEDKDIENLILEEFTDKKESSIFKIINNFLINYKFIILFLIIILLYLKRYYIL
jgi:hypothetical protein